MKRVMGLLIGVGALVGCSGPDQGAAIPKREAPTETQLASMPPQARAMAENAAKAGNYQEQRMREMAEAQRKAGH